MRSSITRTVTHATLVMCGMLGALMLATAVQPYTGAVRLGESGAIDYAADGAYRTAWAPLTPPMRRAVMARTAEDTRGCLVSWPQEDSMRVRCIGDGVQVVIMWPEN
jgi:hypothetical protein